MCVAFALCACALCACADHAAQVFHYVVENGLTFLCMTDEAFVRRTAFAFLDDVKRRWT